MIKHRVVFLVVLLFQTPSYANRFVKTSWLECKTSQDCKIVKSDGCCKPFAINKEYYKKHIVSHKNAHADEFCLLEKEKTGLKPACVDNKCVLN